jgi:peptidoglycan/LPS O-acetylase OafA/YrhL
MGKMKAGIMRRNNKRRIRSARRHRKLLWIFGGIFSIGALLYWEQSGLLFVLSTLAICGLLLVVAFSNLEAKDKEIHNRALEKLNTDSDEWKQRENKVA